MPSEPSGPPSESASRQIVLTDVPPGLWLVIGGGAVAALGPLFGLLIGSMLGSTTDRESLEPIYLFLFLGLAVGAVGVAVMILGARRLVQRDRAASRAATAADKTPVSVPEAAVPDA